MIIKIFDPDGVRPDPWVTIKIRPAAADLPPPKCGRPFSEFPLEKQNEIMQICRKPGTESVTNKMLASMPND